MTFQFELPNGFTAEAVGVFERGTRMPRPTSWKKDGTEVRVPARGVRHGKVIPDRPAESRVTWPPHADTDQEVSPMSDELPTSLIRLRLGQEDAHYGATSSPARPS